MDTLVSIIIPAHNQLAYCRACVESLRRCTVRPYRLILVDNGSTDGVGAYFDEVPDAIPVHTGANLGFAGGVNLGLEHAAGHVVLLNSDTLLTPGWLDRIERALKSVPDAGLAGPMTNCAPGPQQIDGLVLRDAAEIDAFAVQLAGKRGGRVREVSRLVGFCLMIRDTALDRLGRFDERYGIGNFEDDDYCLRARRAGYKLVIAEDAFVFHHGGRTFQAMGIEGEAFRQLLESNRGRFEAKWGMRVARPMSPDRRAAQLNRQAHEALGEGNSRDAVRLLREAISVDPENPRHYNDLGVILWHGGRHETAYDLFVQALRCDPGDADVLANLRDAAERLERTDRLRALLKFLGVDG